LVAGRNVAVDPLGVRQRIGVVFQDSVLDNDFSGADNLRLHARLFGLRPEIAGGRIEALLRLMDLDRRADDGVRTYSGGMRRRLEIARGAGASSPTCANAMASP
jgi:ABC-2 type transport system ATP-binding protein